MTLVTISKIVLYFYPFEPTHFPLESPLFTYPSFARELIDFKGSPLEGLNPSLTQMI